jgi:D-alanine transaminase
VARTVVIEVARAHGLRVEERAFSVEEAYAAREAFMTAASQIVLPVVRIDEHPIGSGTPGPIAIALRRDFHRYAEVS